MLFLHSKKSHHRAETAGILDRKLLLINLYFVNAILRFKTSSHKQVKIVFEPQQEFTLIPVLDKKYCHVENSFT
jgi:hypothetical protein